MTDVQPPARHHEETPMHDTIAEQRERLQALNAAYDAFQAGAISAQKLWETRQMVRDHAEFDESCLPAVIVHVSAMDDTPVPDADQNERDQNTARTARLIKESL